MLCIFAISLRLCVQKLFLSPEHYPRTLLEIRAEAEVISIFPVMHHEQTCVGRVFSKVVGEQYKCKVFFLPRFDVEGFLVRRKK